MAGVTAEPLLAPEPTAAKGSTRGEPSAVELNVNGVTQKISLDARTTLLDALREHLHLTGSKKRMRSGPMRSLYGSGRWRTRAVVSHVSRRDSR